MTLIKNANKWHKMWSIRFALLSALLAAIEITLPLFQVVMNDKWFAWSSMIAAIASAFARIFNQTYGNSNVQQSETTDQSE